MTALESFTQGLRTFASDIVQGFLEVTHSGSALLGLGVLFAALTLTLRPDLRISTEAQLIGWLQARQTDALGIVFDISAIGRATATNPDDLPKQQAALAYWISRKYKVAPEPVSALVAEAYDLGAKARLEPTLILAVVAVESGFNPFAQSPVGAQGLMQVMTHVHSDKFDRFGGKLATFDPVSNLRVGVKVLQECIKRGGSLEAGLRYYVGAAHLEDDGGYVDKVLAEHERLKQVAQGQASASPLLRTAVPAPSSQS